MQAAGRCHEKGLLLPSQISPRGSGPDAVGEHARLPDQDQLQAGTAWVLCLPHCSALRDAGRYHVMHLEEHGTSSPSVMIQVGWDGERAIDARDPT
jgi:hypothetical protein